MELPEVADRMQLRDLVDAYADTADRRDADGFTALFAPDATLVVLRPGAETASYTGRARLAEIPDRLRRYRETFHVTTNHRASVDGDRAHGGASCQAHHLVERDGVTLDVVLTIRYEDTYERTPSGWQFARREVHILWTSEHPVIA